MMTNVLPPFYGSQCISLFKQATPFVYFWNFLHKKTKNSQKSKF